MVILPFRHPDAHFSELLAGTLPERTSQRLLRHVQRCRRCKLRYERLVLAERMLAGDNLRLPAPAELSLLRTSHLHAALAAAQSRPHAPRRGALLGLASALAAGVALAVLLVRPREDTWMARGSGQTEAVLRVFCSRPSRDIVELRDQGTCPRDGHLAFAVGALADPTQVVVRIRGDGLDVTHGPTSVTARPGHESPLELTVPLASVRSGEVEVVASFAQHPEQAASGASGAAADAVVLRQRVVVSAP